MDEQHLFRIFILAMSIGAVDDFRLRTLDMLTEDARCLIKGQPIYVNTLRRLIGAGIDDIVVLYENWTDNPEYVPTSDFYLRLEELQRRDVQIIRVKEPEGYAYQRAARRLAATRQSLLPKRPGSPGFPPVPSVRRNQAGFPGPDLPDLFDDLF